MSISSLYIMPTLECNCRCEYCYIPEPEKKPAADTDHFLKVMEKFIQEADKPDPPYVPQLRFIGGEPYLCQQKLFSLTARFLEAFPGHLAVINSNATLVSPEAAAYWKSLPGRIVHIVSLDGLKDLHDKRRILSDGGSSFDLVIRGIRLLQDQGLPVFCNMVLDRESGSRTGQFFEFVKKDLGMNDISLSLRSESGYWKSADEQFLLLGQAYSHAEYYGLRVTGHHRLYLGHCIPELKCRAGCNTLVITPEARFSACQRFVGKSAEAAFNPDMNLAEHRAGLETADFCYHGESRALGEKLFGLYNEKYRQYLEVTELDRVFFGVI